MDFKNVAALFCLALSSGAVAKVQVEATKFNDLVLTNNYAVIDTNETQSLIVENIRIQVALNELNELIFDLAEQDEKGDFVSYYRAPAIPMHDGDEIGFGSTSGLSLVLKITQVK